MIGESSGIPWCHIGTQLTKTEIKKARRTLNGKSGNKENDDNCNRRSGACPGTCGSGDRHRYLTVSGYGDYFAADGSCVTKPQINLNAKWLADAGFGAGEKIDVEVKENELVIRKLAVGE